jgi:putative transposase
VYYQPVGESEENLHLMELMDNEYLKHPTHGVLQMQDFLISQGLTIVLPVSFF